MNQEKNKLNNILQKNAKLSKFFASQSYSYKKDLNYERKLSDNKGIYYYPLKRNFASIEEEKNYIHYYGEDVIDRVSRLNESVYKKDNFIQDDVITNFIFIYLLNKFKDSSDLIKIMKSTLKKKIITKNDIFKREKLLYDRYHGLVTDNLYDFSFLSCKKTDSVNILSLFQNNKQLYCNIDNIYDCNFHTAIEPNFDNPNCYDQFRYLLSFKNLMEYSLYILENVEYNKINSLEENKEIINDELMYHIDNNNDSVSNTSTKNVSNGNCNSNSNSNTNSNVVTNDENINININNSQNNNPNNNCTTIDSDIIIENIHGICKTINFEENNNENNENNQNLNFKSYILKLIQEYNKIITKIDFQDESTTPIKKIRFSSSHISNAPSACSDLCFKNLLICENDLIEKAFKESINRKFPAIYECLFIKFVQMLKYNPCSICKLLKHIFNKEQKFNIDCYEIYFHMINAKYNISKIINNELLNINLKEKEILKKNLASRKNEEKNLKNKYLPYTPCAHFGNEVCDENCPCAEREYCERYCKCNKLLCKFSNSHLGCHCFKGDCVTNHCPCYVNAKECDPVICKNCYKANTKCKNRQLYLNCQAKIIVGISKIAGWGLFANEAIKKDALIGEYKGELINEDITNKRDRFKIYENSTYMFTLDDEYTIDSRKIGNMLRYANHSKKNANSYPRVVFCGGHHRIGLFAKRHINKGEEIKFDYDGQNILSKQFPWINDENEEKEKVEGNYIKRKKNKKKLALIKSSKHKNKEENDDNTNSINNKENNKNSKSSNNSNLNNEKTEEKKEEEKYPKMEIEAENEILNNNNTNVRFTRSSVKKASKLSKDRMLKIFKGEEKNNDINNNKNSLSLIEDKKEEEEKSLNSNIKKTNIDLGNKKYPPLSATMIAQTLLSHKRYFDKKNEEFLSKKYEETNNANTSMQNIKISVNSFNEQNKIKKITENDYINNNMMFFKDKQIKLLNSKPEKNSNDNKINNIPNNKEISIKIYDLGTIRVMINFETPIVADFAFYGPKNTDFFKKYDILKFQQKDILDEVKADFDKDIYGYLINGNFNKGHMILVRYLKFYEKRVYFYRNDNLKMNIYIFGNGKIKNLILQKCGVGLDENKLTFLIKSDLNNY